MSYLRLCRRGAITLFCGTCARTTTSAAGGGGAAPSLPVRRPRFPAEQGLSAGLSGFGHYGGSISAFMKPEHEKAKSAPPGAAGDGPLPCDTPGSQAALQAAQAQHMAAIAMTGKLPSPKRSGPPRPSSLPKRAPALAQAKQIHAAAPRAPKLALADASRPRVASATKPEADGARGTTFASAAAASTATATVSSREREAADYYRSIPKNELSKEEMWRRINAAGADNAERRSSALRADEVDYVKMEEELREFDLFHYRIGGLAYPDAATRRDYYAMWMLSTSLNKARWTMLEVHSQRGMKTTGAGMKLLFWKESINGIMEQRRMAAGQFTDSHPVLRPFATAVERNPGMTKAFVRGFTDARLKVIQQPGNVKQLFDHFDKFYGFFFNALLEVTHVKDENAEHMMLHIGRAIGLTNHCVMFWKKYARIGFTMLPADLCADHHVNLALLKNISLASRDRAVRRLLFDVMCLVKDEMLHAQRLAKDVPPKAWPIVMECLYPNYYLGFLQRRDFNVSAMFADHNIENAGFAWYRLKKRWEWGQHQSIERLVSEAAPLPFIGTSFAHRGSRYKVATSMARQSNSK